MMTWANFYLLCFALGFAFSLISFIGGGMRWHLHLPHLPHSPFHAGHAVSHGSASANHHGHIMPFNFVTLTAFLAWFGGIGYMLARYSNMWFAMGLGIALLGGLGGASIVYLFLARVLSSDEECLDPADFEMTGVLGRLSVPIRAGGTGEIIYSQVGTRRTCGARADHGEALPKGSEVIVTRYEKGIAYVRLWSELSGEDAGHSQKEAAQ